LGVTAPTGANPALEAKCLLDGSRLAGTVEGFADRQKRFLQFACAFAITYLNGVLSSVLKNDFALGRNRTRGHIVRWYQPRKSPLPDRATASLIVIVKAAELDS